MYKQYFKQTIHMMKESPWLTFISIFGTALAISLIMTIIIAHQAMYRNMAPETARERTLYVKWVGVQDKLTESTQANGYLSLKTIRECFQSLEIPEAVSITSPAQSRLATIPGDPGERCFVLFTDDVFWKVCSFNVLKGNLYTKAEFDAGIRKVVISEKLARRMFGSVDEAVGKSIQLSFVPYTVCAVVADVTPRTTFSYAHAWVPFTSANIPEIKGSENIMGHYKCMIMARSSSDFDEIREEIVRRTEQYNKTLVDHKVYYYQQPDTKYVEEMRFGPGMPDMTGVYLNSIIPILIALLVPAINLSGLTLSRMQERVSELGVRKAFGSTRAGLLGQIVYENIVLSVISGALGLLFSYWFLYLLKDWVFTSSTYFGMDVTAEVPVSILFRPEVFLIAFLFCSLLNLLSACVPAWRVSSIPIVESLKGE